MDKLHLVSGPEDLQNEPLPLPGRHYTAADLVLTDFPDPGGYLGGNMLNPGTLSMFAGMPGAGKSMLTALLGERIATGKHFGPLACKQGRVLYISEEMSEPIPKKRLERLFGIDHLIRIEQDYRWVFKPGLDLNQADSRKALHMMVKQYKAKVVFLDCFTDIHRADENSNQEMAKWMGLVRDRTAIELGCCVVFIHHFRKKFGTERDDIRGAQSIRATLSDLLFVVADADVPSSGLIKADKVRDGAVRPPIRYDISDGLEGRLLVDFAEAA